MGADQRQDNRPGVLYGEGGFELKLYAPWWPSRQLLGGACSVRERYARRADRMALDQRLDGPSGEERVLGRSID